MDKIEIIINSEIGEVWLLHNNKVIETFVEDDYITYGTDVYLPTKMQTAIAQIIVNRLKE